MRSQTKNSFEWIKGAKIYQVFTDRFAGHKEKFTDEELRKDFLYGNLKALITKLDYIKSMGFNMVWITPFYVNQPKGYHGYHAENYNHVDPRFAYGEKIEDNNKGDVFDPNDVNIETGADLVLKELIQECHKRDLKIMMDFVPNHSYETHPFFVDAKKNVNSKYRNWFYFLEEKEEKKEKKEEEKKEKKYKHLSFLFFSDLPKLNLENPEVQEHLVNSTKKFLSYGIDAVRVDHVVGPHQKSLKEIVSKVHQTYPNVPFIGETLPFGCSAAPETVFGTSKEMLIELDKKDLNALNLLDELNLSYIGVLDGVLDFTFQFFVDMFVEGKLSEEECIKKLEDHYKKYEKNKDFILVKNIDSHDCDRIMFRCKNNMKLFQKAIELLYRDYSERNDPLVVYYGTEDFMNQEKTIQGEPYGDFRCRQPMYFTNDWINKYFKEKK